MCILDPKIDRSRGRRRTFVVSCALLAFLIFPLSISGIWESKAQEKSKKTKQEELEKKKKEMEKKMKMAGEKVDPSEKIKLMWEKIESQDNSAAVLVHEAMVEKGPDGGIKMFKKLKSSGDDKYYFKESEFNTLGYKFLHAKKVKEAIAVFKLNVDEYPDSWNVYDSLGEACMVAGELDCARKYYEKSLVLNPENENGKKMLAKLEEKAKSGKMTTTSK